MPESGAPRGAAEVLTAGRSAGDKPQRALQCSGRAAPEGGESPAWGCSRSAAQHATASHPSVPDGPGPSRPRHSRGMSRRQSGAVGSARCLPSERAGLLDHSIPGGPGRAPCLQRRRLRSIRGRRKCRRAVQCGEASGWASPPDRPRGAGGTSGAGGRERGAWPAPRMKEAETGGAPGGSEAASCLHRSPAAGSGGGVCRAARKAFDDRTRRQAKCPVRHSAGLPEVEP